MSENEYYSGKLRKLQRLEGQSLEECLQDELYNISSKNKTSREWQEIYPDVRIVNPDGWDRSNFEYSWNEELISLEEYENRVRESSIVKKL